MSRTTFFIHLALKTCLVVSGLMLLACDPCYELSERICACKDNEEEKRQCVTELNQAKTHNAFSFVRDPKRCTEALLPGRCTCKDYRDGNYEKCIFYREDAGAR